MHTSLCKGSRWKAGDTRQCQTPYGPGAGSKTFPGSKGWEISCVTLSFEEMQSHHESPERQGSVLVLLSNTMVLSLLGTRDQFLWKIIFPWGRGGWMVSG